MIGGDVGVAYDSHLNIIWDLAQDFSDDGGFTRADFTGQENETYAIYEPVLEIVQGHSML